MPTFWFEWRISNVGEIQGGARLELLLPPLAPPCILQQGTRTLDITCHYVFVSKNTKKPKNPKQWGNVSGFKGEQTTSTLFAKGVCFLVIVRKTTNKNMLSRVTVYYLMFSSYKEYHLSNDFCILHCVFLRHAAL